MSVKILKKTLGDAGAWLDESHGSKNTLYDVLRAMLDAPAPISASQATIATATLGAAVVDRAVEVEATLSTSIGTTGTANDTVISLRKNGAVVATVTTDNAEADGTAKRVSADLSLAVGDVLDVLVTAAPTGGANASVTVNFRAAKIEA